MVVHRGNESVAEGHVVFFILPVDRRIEVIAGQRALDARAAVGDGAYVFIVLLAWQGLELVMQEGCAGRTYREGSKTVRWQFVVDAEVDRLFLHAAKIAELVDRVQVQRVAAPAQISAQ